MLNHEIKDFETKEGTQKIVQNSRQDAETGSWRTGYSIHIQVS